MRPLCWWGTLRAPDLLTWSVVVVDADGNVTGQVGHWVPPLNGEGDARMARFQL